MRLGPRKRRDKRRRSPCEFRGRARNDATEAKAPRKLAEVRLPASDLQPLL